MAHSVRHRQKALEKQAKKRKEKAAMLRLQHHAGGPGGHGQLHVASTWPVLEALLTSGWDEPMALVEALVARRSPSGRIAVGVFLIDLGCLGVKNAYVAMFDSYTQYAGTLRRSFLSKSLKMETDLNLIAKIIREAIGYAADLGFAPHHDYRDAVQMLAGADPDASLVPIPLGGPDGIPVYINGPYDNAPAIIAHLERRLGPGGFEVLLHIELPVMIDGDMDEDDMDEDDDFLDQNIDEVLEQR